MDIACTGPGWELIMIPRQNLKTKSWVENYGGVWGLYEEPVRVPYNADALWQRWVFLGEQSRYRIPSGGHGEYSRRRSSRPRPSYKVWPNGGLRDRMDQGWWWILQVTWGFCESSEESKVGSPLCFSEGIRYL